MSASPSIDARDSGDKLPEVSRLAALLARNVLDAQIEGRPVPDDQIRFLLDAALLLNEYGVALPSLLGQIMHGASEPKADDPSPPIGSAAADDDAGRLAWLLRPFQARKG